jgi:hypothetical protein
LQEEKSEKTGVLQVEGLRRTAQKKEGNSEENMAEF